MSNLHPSPKGVVSIDMSDGIAAHIEGWLAERGLLLAPTASGDPDLPAYAVIPSAELWAEATADVPGLAGSAQPVHLPARLVTAPGVTHE